MHILLIEDDSIFATLVEKSLPPGYHLDWCKTLAEGKAHANGHNCILSDLSLPDSTPEETAEVLCEELADYPRIIMTGYMSEDLCRKFARSGCSILSKCAISQDQLFLTLIACEEASKNKKEARQELRELARLLGGD